MHLSDAEGLTVCGQQMTLVVSLATPYAQRAKAFGWSVQVPKHNDGRWCARCLRLVEPDELPPDGLCQLLSFRDPAEILLEVGAVVESLLDELPEHERELPVGKLLRLIATAWAEGQHVGEGLDVLDDDLTEAIESSRRVLDELESMKAGGTVRSRRTGAGRSSLTLVWDAEDAREA